MDDPDEVHVFEDVSHSTDRTDFSRHDSYSFRDFGKALLEVGVKSSSV